MSPLERMEAGMEKVERVGQEVYVVTALLVSHPMRMPSWKTNSRR